MSKKYISGKTLGFYDSQAAKKIAKVRITTYLDHDILIKLKILAKENNKAYQSLLNEILRKWFLL